MFKEILGTILLTAFSVKSTPQRAVNQNKFYGTYNIREVLDTSYFEEELETYQTSIVFDNSTNEEVQQYINPVYYNDKVWYLYSMYLDYSTYGRAIGVELNVYDEQNFTSVIEFNLSDATDTFTDLTQAQQELIIYIRGSYNLTSYNYALVNSVFTHDDNPATTTYNGYYTWNINNLNMNYKWGIFGNITLGTKMTYGLFGQKTNNNNDYTNSLYYLYYEPQTDNYAQGWWHLPLTYDRIPNQWYISNSKMSLSTYNLLSTYGTFAYVPEQAPQEYSFDDLFFSIADTPIYFVYSMFNWQLFGANLFIAFLGLISFGLILVLFRKFL